MNHTIRVTKTDENAQTPNPATEGSFGYDLTAVAEQTIEPGGTAIVPTGLKLAADLPAVEGGGIAMLILPRSSLPLKRGLMVANSPGLIDADYSGEIGIPIYNFKSEPATIAPGERLAQAVFVQLLKPTIEEAEPDESRNRGGFGSTGQ